MPGRETSPRGLMVGARGYCAECGIPREPNVDACPSCGVVYPLGSSTLDRPPPPAARPRRRSRTGVRGHARVLLYLLLAAALAMVVGTVVVEIAASI
jgi:hypothetical protein